MDQDIIDSMDDGRFRDEIINDPAMLVADMDIDEGNEAEDDLTYSNPDFNMIDMVDQQDPNYDY